MGNCVLEVLSKQSDSEEISDIKEVSGAKQERGEDRMNSIGNAMANLKDISTSYLAWEANMFSGRQMAGREKMLNDLSEIEKSNADEECVTELNARLGSIANRIEISDENERKINESKERNGKKKGKFREANTTLRNRLQESIQK